MPVPYIRWNANAAILVAANRDATHDAQLTLRVPLKDIGWAGRRRYKVTSLWPAGESKTYRESELESLACTIKRDKTPAGGLGVFKLEAES